MISRGRGLLVVLSGPSGVGKGTVVAAASRAKGKIATRLRRSISVTTRAPRADEEDGVHYFFRTREEFACLVQAGALLEWATYLDQSYGTPREWVDRQLADGYDVVLEIEVQGARQIRERHPGAVFVYMLPPSWEELRHRLAARGTDSEATQQRRIDVAAREIKCIDEYDYLIVNDEVAAAARRFLCILEAEHSRVPRLESQISDLTSHISDVTAGGIAAESAQGKGIGESG